MSSWTYVGGLIEVDTFAQTSLERYIQQQKEKEHE